MGKWTHNYTDDVLTAKVSALITGAIRRSALENPGALPPTYNEFVHELDTGDSFTTTMVDILVKEVMERRKRPAGDRRLISEKTAKNLRILSGSLHGRSTTTTSRMTRYPPIRTSTSREPFYVDTDDDDYEFMDSNPAEGAAMSSSALFDAMQQHRALSAFDSTTAGGSGSIPPPPLVLPPRSGRVSPWTALPATSTNPHTTRTISQPSSLRRSVGTGRTRELPDWPPPRRRIRAAAALAPRAAELVTEPREGVTPDSSTTWSTGHRRFFGLNRIRRAAARRGSVGLSEGSGGEDETTISVSFLGGLDGAGPSSSSSSAAVVGSSTGAGTDVMPSQPISWPEGSQIYVSPRPVMLRDIEPAPPLRRGGVIPPESLLTQLQYLPTEPPSPGPELELIEAQLLGEPAAYPTPGSVDNEHST